MKLSDIIQRESVPEPWSEGYKIPWDDPGFSERMLPWHLRQDNDAASRRFERIDRQVSWIHQELLSGAMSHVLDLGCGPGLYSERLARLGHVCHGIDFGPASIAYAREQAEAQGLTCQYDLADLRTAKFGQGYDLAMLIYGEFNVFAPADIESILRRAWGALEPGGWLLLEPQTYEYVADTAAALATWYSSIGGLWSARPHLCLEEHHWDEETSTGTTRYFIVDGETNAVSRFAQSQIAYSEDDFRELLARCGYEQIAFLPGLTDDADYDEPYFLAITARKPRP